MEYPDLVRQHEHDPENFETLYQEAVKKKTTIEFASAVHAAYKEAPENLLFAAWYYRLRSAAEPVRQVFWKLAVPLALVCGLLVWFLSDDNFQFVERIPLFMMLWGPIAAVGVLAYLSFSAKKGIRNAVLLAVGIAAFTAYVLLVVPTMKSWSKGPAADLMAIHLPVLVLAAVGTYATGVRSSPDRRFAFVIKLFEVVVTGGLFVVAIAIFWGITLGLFSALGINIPESVMRLIIAGGGGMLPVIVVAIIYNPLAAPEEQDFNQGLSKFLANLLRIMILPTLLVAVLYVFFIPFNFMEPFYNRDVLFIYNGMLFAVIALLIGATPVQTDDLSSRLQVWLRYAILAVAALAVLVSLYALSAIVYRTWMDTLTMNRLTVIGWNVVNIGVLGYLLYRQFSTEEKNWVPALKSAFHAATAAYTIWSAFIVLAIPILYH